MKYPDIPFGQGKVRMDADFFSQSLEEQARQLGWADSCPVVDELLEARGDEQMRNRYGQVNFWFRTVVHEAEEHNPDLAVALTSDMPRHDDEPVGVYEPAAVDEAHAKRITPMGTLVGWASSRLLIQQLGLNMDLDKETKADQFFRGIDAMHVAILDSHTPAEFLARLAEGVAHADLEPKQVVGQILNKGWLEEHNAFSQVTELTRALNKYAPTVWSAYSAMPSSEKAESGIINLVTDDIRLK